MSRAKNIRKAKHNVRTQILENLKIDDAGNICVILIKEIYNAGRMFLR
jgi:hypothetical protein